MSVAGVAVPGLGVGIGRHTAGSRGLAIMQPRASQVFQRGSAVCHRNGVLLAEVPSARTDLVTLGYYNGDSTFTASATADSNGGAVDPVTLIPQTIAVTPISAEGTGWFATGTGGNQITAANLDQDCFWFDDDTLYLTDLNGTLSWAGKVAAVDPTTSRVALKSDALFRALYELFSATFGSPFSASPPGYARGALTNLGGTVTYAAGTITGPSNTALPTQDGLTPVVGQVFWAGKWLANLPNAQQAGPWEVVSLGSGSSQYVLARPSWWTSGAALPTESQIKIGPEGTVYKSSIFVTTATAGGTIDTTDPAYQFLAQAGAVAMGGSSARLVGTNLGGTATYASGFITGPSNTALPTQDGVAPAVGDVIFLPKNLANLPNAQQAGPWAVLSLGSGSSQYLLARPPWYVSGATLPLEAQVKIGPEGIVFPNALFQSTATGAAAIDTTDPAYTFSIDAATRLLAPCARAVRGVVTVNETLTAFDSVTGGTIRDGVTYVQGDLVLLVNQNTASQNGPYVVGPVAANVAPLSRPPWWQTGATAIPGSIFSVSEGTQGANSQWLLRTTGAITIDTTGVAIDMIGGNWVQGVSTAVGTMAAQTNFFFVGATLKARLSGIFEVHLDIGWSDGTTGDTVTFALISDTVADGAGAVLASANKVNHGVTGLGTYGTRGADWESCDTNAGAAITFNGAAFSTAPVTQASEVNPTLTGLLSGSAQKFGFHGITYNAAPTGTTKTPFTIGNQVAFGVKVTSTNTITVASCRITVKELPAQ